MAVFLFLCYSWIEIIDIWAIWPEMAVFGICHF